MGALSDLLQRTDIAATPATPATQPSVAVGESQESQESQGVEPEMRARLPTLAEAEGVDAAHVHRLHADDVAACSGLDDEELRRYLRRLERVAGMNAGIVPAGWDAVAHCAGCGPVHLWEPLRVIACPWCFRRKAGNRIPRPLVQCGGCVHYVPNPLNPEAGMGSCAQGVDRAYWPMRRHSCADLLPPDNGEQAHSLLVSDSVEVTP